MRPSLLTFAAALLLGAALPAAACAAADIEGTWSFSGGQVVVAPATTADGSFTGTVIRPTTFSRCTHVVGEDMWTGMRLQPDGQYFGKHQWFNDATCAYNPRGNTAYRVLKKPDGASFMRVCFAAPEAPDLQPTIAADGTSANTSTGCVDSDLLAPPAPTPTLASITQLPTAKRCLSRRSFRIRLKEPKGDALDSAKVYVNGKLVRTVKRQRITAPVVLKGLPKGRYKVKITAKTILGKTITGTRTYRTCAKKRPSKSTSRI